MREYIKEIADYLGFPAEATESLLEVWDIIQTDYESKRKFDECIERYNSDCMYYDWNEYDKALEASAKISEKLKIDHRRTDLLLFMCFSRHCRELYERFGYSEEMFRTSMLDMYAKLTEEHNMSGVWGTSVAIWFGGFFNLDRFGFGILQFELIEFGWQSYKNNNGDELCGTSRIINVHIPGLGKLDHDEVQKAYRLAADFFSERIPSEKIPFMCASWLLYKPANDTLPEGSNIRKFMDDFDVFHVGEEQELGDMWRIFGNEFTNDFEKLPEKTAVQRAYKKWLLSGKTVSNGSGVFFIDRPNINGVKWKQRQRMYSFYADYDAEAEARGDYRND